MDVKPQDTSVPVKTEHLSRQSIILEMEHGPASATVKREKENFAITDEAATYKKKKTSNDSTTKNNAIMDEAATLKKKNKSNDSTTKNNAITDEAASSKKEKKCNDSTSKNNAITDEAASSKKEKKCNDSTSKNNGSSENGMSLAQCLPEVPLRMIFMFLSLNDLINVQYVCKHWYDVTKINELWKDKVWFCDYYNMRQGDKYKQQLENAPMLQHVVISTIPRTYFFTRDKVLETVLLCLKDLRSIDCDIGHWKVIPKLVEKFPNLQSIRICVCLKDAAASLEALATCQHLQHLEFEKCFRNHSCDRFSKVGIQKTTELLGDSFSSLLYLDLSFFQSSGFLSQENIINILEKKGNQLKKFKVDYRKDCSEEILNTISHFKHLEVTLGVEKLFSFDILSPLRSLNIDYLCKHVIINSLSGVSMPNVHSIAMFVPEVSLFARMALSFPSLKYLTLKLFFVGDVFIHLEDFPHLKNICIRTCLFLSGDKLPSLFSSIIKCSSLESLKFDFVALNQRLLQSISQCCQIRFLTFHRCNFTFEPSDFSSQIINLLDSLYNLKCLYMIYCCSNHMSLSESVLTDMAHECSKRGVSLQTTPVESRWTVDHK